MICSKCDNLGVQNTVLGKSFYYCRTCKDEITATKVKIITSTEFKIGDKVRCKFTQEVYTIENIVTTRAMMYPISVIDKYGTKCVFSEEELELV